MNAALLVGLLASVVTLCRAQPAGAGRAFPIDSENYVIEQFNTIEPRLAWDPTNFLVDLSGQYANCRELRPRQLTIDRQTPEGDFITGFVDNSFGSGTDVDAVNGYIRTMVDEWINRRTYNNMIRDAERFGCSVRPGCSGRAVVSCLFSRPRGTIYEYDEPNDEPNDAENVGEAPTALAFTEEQYEVAERHTGNRWDRSHLLENMSGYETSCEMIGTTEWPFNKATLMAADYGIQRFTPVYGWAPNVGSTDGALDTIFDNLKQVEYASQLGCSIVPDCMVESEMYVVVSCLYQEQ